MYSSKRPKLQIPKTASEWVADIIGMTIFTLTIILLITVWGKLPAEVPAHYNAAGQVDRWGSKWELLILPFVSLFSFLLVYAFEKFPEMHNYPKRFNENNAAEFYLISRQLLNQIKNIMMLLFAALTFETISIALDWGFVLGKFLLPVLIITIFLPILLCIYRQRKIT